MTTFVMTKGGTTKALTAEYVRIPRVLEAIINFASTTYPNSGFPSFTPNATTLSGNAAGDTVNCLTVPAGCIVQLAGFEVTVADTAGNSGTLQVTDGTNTYTSAVTVQTTGIKAFTAAANRLYTTAGTLSFAVATGAVNCTARMFAIITDVNAVDTVVPN